MRDYGVIRENAVADVMNGQSVVDVAKEYSISPARIRYWVAIDNATPEVKKLLQSTRRRKKRKDYEILTACQFINLHPTSGIKEVAASIGASYTEMGQLLKKLGIRKEWKIPAEVLRKYVIGKTTSVEAMGWDPHTDPSLV